MSPEGDGLGSFSSLWDWLEPINAILTLKTLEIRQQSFLPGHEIIRFLIEKEALFRRLLHKCSLSFLKNYISMCGKAQSALKEPLIFQALALNKSEPPGGLGTLTVVLLPLKVSMAFKLFLDNMTWVRPKRNILPNTDIQPWPMN